MATKWVLQSVSYNVNIIGGSHDKGRATVSVRRDGREYSTDVYMSKSSTPGNLGPQMADANLRRAFSSPKSALDAAFTSLRFTLSNGNSRLDMSNIEQTYTYWTPLDEDGKTDWKLLDGLSDKERAEKVNAKFDYNPPTSEGVEDKSRPRQVGKAFDVDVSLDEQTRSKIGGRAAVDGRNAAQAGLKKFMETKGMAPSLDEEGDSGTDGTKVTGPTGKEQEMQKQETQAPSVS